jgi:HEAT repeat protein
MDTPALNYSADRLDQLLDQLANTDDLDRSVEAISLIEAEAVPDWLPRLHEALETQDDFYLREGVAPAVIRLERMVALPRLITALRLGFAEGHDCDGLQSDVTNLIESDPSAAIALLLPLVESSDPADRSDAAWLLGLVHTEVPPDILVGLASDDSSRVRVAACGSLASLEGHEPAFQMLVLRLDDTDEDVRIAAISSLGYLGDTRALRLLEGLVGSSSERARHILDHAISSLKKP